MKTDKEASKSGEAGNKSNYSELPKNEEPSPSKITSKKDTKKSNKENRELKILKRSKTLKDKSDPDRFSGEGIKFKAKIIGTEHVFDARGNRMCQGALQRLKAAVKTSGDHKQRIILNISYNGIIIQDDKTGEILHHHPIHKISFISQDTVDKRSFGYVFGCPQTGHEFFGIKTEKIASQVVLTLRDLFLAALEIKKKEIENAKEAQKETSTVHENGTSDKGSSNGMEISTNGAASEVHSKTLHKELLYSNTVSLPDENSSQNGKENTTSVKPVVDTLLDLQFTMDSLQMGISQMDHSIATAATQGFGLSFSEDDISESSNASLPMSFHFKMDKFSSLYQETLSVSSRSSSTSDYNVGMAESKLEEPDILKKDLAMPATVFENGSSTTDGFTTVNSEKTIPRIPSFPSFSENADSRNSSVIAAALKEAKSKPVEDRYAVFQDIDALPSIFDNPIVSSLENKEELSNFSEEFAADTSNEFEEICENKSSTPIVFAELDPLGKQPFVDKRDFFQDIKNPPKKVLKDLVSNSEIDSVDISSSSKESFKIPNVSTELFPSSSEVNSVELSPFLLNSSSTDQRHVNPFVVNSEVVLPLNPPKLPPKKLNAISSIPIGSEDTSSSVDSASADKWEVKNPFNPFIEEDDFPDIPPPNSPPPPPPPRLPTKVCEIPLTMSPPPPRPPSRSNGIPTPPLPKRKPQMSSLGNTWFSFDQEALNFAPAHYTPNEDTAPDPHVPPIPSPARKLPPCKTESPKGGSASSSPAVLRRLPAQSTTTINSQVSVNDTKIPLSSPRKVLSRHSSLIQESYGFETSVNLFPETRPIVESSIVEETDLQVLDSPPLPPKPQSIARPRPSPSKKMLSSVHNSSFSSSNVSAVESSNGTHSSSSLVFSSSDEGKLGSSAEAIFMGSSDSHTEVFSQSNIETINEQSSTSELAKEPTELSPDSIFRRKSDPFADDFFLSLPKKSVCSNEPNGRESVQKACTNGVDLHFESLEATT